MQGCLVALVVLVLLGGAAQYVLPPLLAVAMVVVAVFGVHGLGSATGLLVVPRTAERWARAIEQCDDDGKLRTIADRFDTWRWSTPRSVVSAASTGLVTGAAWSSGAVTCLVAGAAALGLPRPPLLVIAAVVLAYAAASARAALLNTIMRFEPDEHGLTAISDRLRSRGVATQPVPSRPAVPPAPRATPPSALLTPQPRFRTGAYETCFVSTSPPWAQPPSTSQRAGAPTAPPTPGAVRGEVIRAAAEEHLPHVEAQRQAVTCGACGRGISDDAACGCS